MAKKTSKLGLTLPELNEFQNGWNVPLNQNFEEIDDYVDSLEDSLASTSGLSALKGSTTSLLERIDTSINADGTLKISGSPEYGDIAVSATRGVFSTPQDRLNAADEEAFNAKSPVPYGRFKPMTDGHDAGADGYLRADMDSGMALRSARPNGLIVGPTPLIQAVAATAGQIRINALTNPAIFSIDGYIFHLREDLIVDFTNASPGPNEYFWVYVERGANAYADTTMHYRPAAGGSLLPGDMRKIQSPAFSVALSEVGGYGVAVAAGASFMTGQFKVLPGDLFVVSGGTAAGSYVIKTVDSDTQVTIEGRFKASVTVGSGGWYIYNPAVPKVGLAKAPSGAGLPTSQPPLVDGRVYIGRCQYKSGAQVDLVVNFPAGGAYDSGWILGIDAADFPYTANHNLGSIPSRVEIWFRANDTSPAYRGVVQRQIVTTETFATANLLVPSVHYNVSETDVVVRQLNATTEPSKPAALFTDVAGADVTAGEMRILAWR